MKKYLLGASALAFAASLSGAAMAADIAPEPSTYDWSGFYLGLNAGVAINNSNVDSDVNSSELGPLARELKDDIQDNSAAFTGGGQVGYNWQMDSIVVGLEADINFLGFDKSSSRSFTLDTGEDTFDTTTRLGLESDWYGTIRGRLGYAMDNVLIYGTGGLAYGEVQGTGRINVDGVGVWKGTESEVNWGWTVGAGAEYAIDQNWIIGAEYLYVDLGDVDFDYNNNSSLPRTNGKADVEQRFNVVRATLKYKF